ncbi:MAG TPA: hypothetical protein IAC99_01775 [Candidatus Choladocola avistercoris]|nr:hypothetical protein [Candidatus Choladocola avistercoris]
MKKGYQTGEASRIISVFVIVLRQVILPVPLALLLHFAGLKAVWWTFPLTEVIAAPVCIFIEKSRAV